jgi:O-antigen ligase
VYYGVADPREAWRLVFLMMVAAAGVAAYGVLQHYTGIDLNHAVRGKASQVDPFWFGQNEGFRTEGLFPSGITYAHNMLFPLTLLTTWLVALPRGWRERLGAFAGWLVMVLALIFSLTRGVWIAYFIVVVALGIIKGGRALLTVSLGLILLGGFLFLFNPGVRERATHAFDLKTNLPRSLIWQANIDMAMDRPLLGWGYGNYKRFREPYYQRYPEVDTDAHAHNNLLQMWVDGGVVSFAAFLFLFWSILKRGWVAYRRLPPEADFLRIIVLGGTLSIVGFFIAGFTQYNFGDAEVVIVMWSITGLLMRIYTWTQEGTNEESSPLSLRTGYPISTRN